jgi:hypothetical protein
MDLTYLFDNIVDAKVRSVFGMAKYFFDEPMAD